MSEISRILFYFIDDNVNETRLSVFSFVCRGVTTNNTCSDGFILYTVYITCIMKIIVISHNRQVKYIVLSIKSLNTWSPLSINFMQCIPLIYSDVNFLKFTMSINKYIFNKQALLVLVSKREELIGCSILYQSFRLIQTFFFPMYMYCQSISLLSTYFVFLFEVVYLHKISTLICFYQRGCQHCSLSLFTINQPLTQKILSVSTVNFTEYSLLEA